MTKIITPDPQGEARNSAPEVLGGLLLSARADLSAELQFIRESVAVMGSLTAQERSAFAASIQELREGIAALGSLSRGSSADFEARYLDVLNQIAVLGSLLQEHAASTEAKMGALSQATLLTADATPVTALLATIPEGVVRKLEVDVVASSAELASAASYRLTALVQRDAGVVTFVSGPTASEVYEDVADWDATLVIDGLGVLLSVTGAASTDVTWRALSRLI